MEYNVNVKFLEIFSLKRRVNASKVTVYTVTTLQYFLHWCFAKSLNSYFNEKKRAYSCEHLCVAVPKHSSAC